MRISYYLLTLMLLHLSAVNLYAQGLVPALINYQGTLVDADGNALADGNFDLEFRVYSADSGGLLVWGPQEFDGEGGMGHGSLVPVVGGRFNVLLGPEDTGGDPIANAFNSSSPDRDQRFIEVTAGGTALSRQRILSAPYALAVSGMAVDASGNVSIGPTNVSGRLDLAGNLEITGTNPLIRWNSPSVTSRHMALIASDGSLRISRTAIADDLTIASNGRVGIGTTSPGARLDVRGTIKLGSGGTLFAPGALGNFRIIRGNVNLNGTIAQGEGFSASRLAVGNYQINFSPTFTNVPSVTVSGGDLAGNDDNVANVNFLTRFGFQATLWDTGNSINIPEDSWFSFIAIGPR